MQVAAPVHPSVTLGQQVLRALSVKSIVPLAADHVWVKSCQGIADAGLLASTDRASLTLPGPGLHQGSPDMVMPAVPICAQPPDLAAGTAGETVRGKSTVALGMPLSCKRWVALCQHGLPCNHSIMAEWTSWGWGETSACSRPQQGLSRCLGFHRASLAHSGQPDGRLTLVRPLISALQVQGGLCSLQVHHTTLPEPTVTSAGLSRPMASGSQLAATSGRSAARELQAQGRWPVHTGQPRDLALLSIVACHTWSWPQEHALHSHQAL